MFSKWIIDEDKEDKENVITEFKVEKYDKLRIPPKAQQKLAKSVSAPADYFILKVPKTIIKSKSILDTKDTYSVFVPRLKLTKAKRRDPLINNVKWICGPENTISKSRLKKIKISNLKETVKFTGSCKDVFESYFKKVNYELIPLELEIEKPNQWLVDVPYSTFSSKARTHLDYNNWIPVTNLSPTTILSEEIEYPDINNIVCVKDETEYIPKNYFIGDCLQSEILIPLHKHQKFETISNLTQSKWKFKKSISWKINESIKHHILDEPVRKIEIKYKLLINTFSIPHSYLQNLKTVIKKSVSDKWIFSKYKTYMMNWKPFGEMALEEVLNEECDAKIDIIIPSLVSTDIERYIKMSDLETTKIATVSRSSSYIKVPIGRLAQESLRIQLPQSTSQVPCNIDEVLEDNDYDTSDNELILNNPTINAPSTNSTLPSRETKVVTPISNHNETTISRSDSLQSITQPKDSIITSAKHTISELDSIVMKKKRRSNVAQFDFGKKYPYIDVLNQTTTASIVPPEPVPVPSPPAPIPETNDVLEVTAIEEDVQRPINIPFGKVCNIMLNMEFGHKFGAAYNKFNIMIDQYDNINLSEFEMDNEYKLKFDMFLNPTCGVLFCRPINIYQVDIKTGESLVFKQMSEIASQVLSLIVIIAVEATSDVSNDTRLTKFMEQVEEFGIQLYVITNEPKTIALSMFELIQQYSTFDDESYQWSSEHIFLENCGICNPFLTDWILSKYKLVEFVEMSLDARTLFLLRICTAELTNRINKAVQNFSEMR